jgi:hypothetical protein
VDVTKIGDGAFKECECLEQVIVTEGILEIGNDTFNGCKGLHSISVPDSAKVIGAGAFEECRGLRQISLPNGMLYVADRTFRNCRALEQLHIPSTVRSIGFRAFEGCDSLLHLQLPARFVVTPTLRAYYGINENVNITYEESTFNENKGIAQATIGETIEYGSYPMNKDATVAPILWKVVAEDDGQKLLLSKLRFGLSLMWYDEKMEW